jgi:hypothetical protein
VRLRRALTAFLRRAAITGHAGPDRLTLQMEDGRKQNFFVTSSSGHLQPTGGTALLDGTLRQMRMLSTGPGGMQMRVMRRVAGPALGSDGP